MVVAEFGAPLNFDPDSGHLSTRARLPEKVQGVRFRGGLAKHDLDAKGTHVHHPTRAFFRYTLCIECYTVTRERLCERKRERERERGREGEKGKERESENVCVCVYVCERERERERKRKKESERAWQKESARATERKRERERDRDRHADVRQLFRRETLFIHNSFLSIGLDPPHSLSTPRAHRPARMLTTLPLCKKHREVPLEIFRRWKWEEL